MQALTSHQLESAGAGGINILARREANLKAREENPESEETQWLKALVADLTMGNELLRENLHRLEATRPLGRQRGKR